MAVSQVTVVIHREGDVYMRRELKPGGFDLGRAEDCEICLEDISVSRRHARLHVSEERVFIEDLDSGNGCWFNGRRVRTQTLVDGDEIVIDPFTIKVEFPELSETGQVTAELTLAGEDSTQLFGEEEISLSEPITVAIARLEVVAGEGLPPEIGLDRSVTLGRSEQRDIVLAEPAASRLHAEINLLEDSWFIKDSGSANGLYVNGKITKEKLLEHGDVIRIGATELRFVQLEESSDTGTMMMTPEDLQEVVEPPVGLQGPGDGTEDFVVKEDPGLCHLDSLGVRSSGGATEDFTGTNTTPPIPETTKTAPEIPEAPVSDSFLSGGPPPPAFGSVPDPPPFAPQSVGTQEPVAPPVAPPDSSFAAPSAPLLPPELSPDLGPAPESVSAFGGVEMQLNTSSGKAKKLKVRNTGEGLFGNWVRVVTLFLLGFVGLVMVFRLVGTAPSSSGQGGGSTSSAFEGITDLPTSAVNAKVEQYLQDGQGLFREKKYFDAFGKFNQALQLAPDNENAERLQYMACEFVSIDKLFNAVQSRAASDSERREAKVAALEAGRGALSNGRGYQSALSKVRAALGMNQGDPELGELEAQLSRKVGAIQVDRIKRTREELIATMEKLIRQGEQERARENFDQAISKCNAAMDKDPEKRQSKLFYEAEGCVNKARADRRRAASVHYKKCLNFEGSGRLLEARSACDQALRRDRDYAAAKTKRDQVQRRLRAKASDDFNHAVVLQKANNYEMAITYYTRVMELVGDTSDRLYQNAEKRLQELTGG
ncbi:MAG: FHA domain-containing protein [Myxococcota bacterium]|nr:FHA domain-containing protein [Myxococcota bacterium]